MKHVLLETQNMRKEGSKYINIKTIINKIQKIGVKTLREAVRKLKVKTESRESRHDDYKHSILKGQHWKKKLRSRTEIRRARKLSADLLLFVFGI